MFCKMILWHENDFGKMTLWHENILQNDFMTWKWFCDMKVIFENDFENSFWVQKKNKRFMCNSTVCSELTVRRLLKFWNIAKLIVNGHF